MLICGDCGAMFQQAVHAIETHGLDSPPYEEYSACPECYGMCVLEAILCDCCGSIIDGEYVETDTGERYCSACYVVKDIMD